jgi:carboxymethylenebutenolidase
MCFDLDSRPPIPPLQGAAVEHRRTELTSEDGTKLAAFEARAERPSGAGVVVLPDVRGLHPFYEELALRFAEAGIDAVAIDYFGRTAGTDPRPDDFDHMAHVEQTRYESHAEDIVAAAEALKQGGRVERVFTIGFCFGGRLSFLMATRADMDPAGVIGFYGWPVGPGRAGLPAPADLVDRFSAPVLALFGGADDGIPVESIDAFHAALDRAGVDHELEVYPGAPHGFFDKKAAEFGEESADAWERVLRFIRGHPAAAA